MGLFHDNVQPTRQDSVCGMHDLALTKIYVFFALFSPGYCYDNLQLTKQDVFRGMHSEA